MEIIKLTAEQQVFMLFFAIIWGMVANVQPRWKAFHWTLFCRHKPARNRVCLSVILLNVIPLAIFGYVLWVLNFGEKNIEWPILHLIVHGVIPAFALFGCYRLWLATVEKFPKSFYSDKVGKDGVPTAYQYLEPIYRYKSKPGDDKRKTPIVYLGEDTWWPNAGAALLYLILGMTAPWIIR